jgi:hypothetical protein
MAESGLVRVVDTAGLGGAIGRQSSREGEPDRRPRREYQDFGDEAHRYRRKHAVLIRRERWG